MSRFGFMDTADNFVFTPKFGNRNSAGAIVFGAGFTPRASRSSAELTFSPVRKSNDMSGAFFRVALAALAFMVGYMFATSFYSGAPTLDELLENTWHDISSMAKSFWTWLSVNIDWLNRELF